MQMYHVTETSNVNVIMDSGLEAQWSSAATSGGKINDDVVYLFASSDDAVDFAEDNHFDEYTIISVDVDDLDLISDTEYDDGIAYAHIGDVDACFLSVD